MSGPLPHDISAVTGGKPTFYTEREFAPVRQQLEAQAQGGTYRRPDGTPLGEDQALTSAGAVLARVLKTVLAEASKNPAGYWLSDAEVLTSQLEPLQVEVEGAAAVMLADALLVLQATWANAGDNDYLRGLTGTERLLLDLEALTDAAP